MVRFSSRGAYGEDPLAPPEIPQSKAASSGALSAQRGCKKLVVQSQPDKNNKKKAGDAAKGKDSNGGKDYVLPVPGLAQQMASMPSKKKESEQKPISTKGKGIFDGGLAAFKQERQMKQSEPKNKPKRTKRRVNKNDGIKLPEPLQKGFNAIGGAFNNLATALGKLTDPQQVSRSLGLSKPRPA
ncbi:hypothetical protein RI054_09g47630 [Pseudoscourfieldia marina]